MARHPLRDCWARELPVLLLLLLRPPQTRGTTCSTPTSIEHANIQVKSYNENSRERYICNSGFKRKAGTSSLTKCLRNEDTNITQWTIPTLICIRDPSLTRQRPSSTVAPAGVTPEPESPSPSGKEPAFISKPDTTVATKPAVVPGSRLMPSKSPAGTTRVVRNEPSQAPPQTTAKALEHTPSTSLEKPGAHSSNSTAVTGTAKEWRFPVCSQRTFHHPHPTVAPGCLGYLLCPRPNMHVECGSHLHTCHCVLWSMCGITSGMLS
ncbi:interleukin-15 receptor subunit alpha isoform X3 [Myotis lucifugus]|uniref:interleukin-15 receptor subunit alpha isoform X3 n=1 Tax=Myotis lucifugus TaxID=59463 RepID=UPI000CCC773F|nr:interleukin-15 receptor subunit alpha isoform X3 [Myotis lucifugus]